MVIYEDSMDDEQEEYPLVVSHKCELGHSWPVPMIEGGGGGVYFLDERDANCPVCFREYTQYYHPNFGTRRVENGY